MITATELRKRITARPRLKMDDVIDFYDDLQECLAGAAINNNTWTNTFFSCTKSSFKNITDFQRACKLDLLLPLENLGYDIRTKYFIGINEEWTISIWLGWED